MKLTPFQIAVIQILMVVLSYIAWQYRGKVGVNGKAGDVADADYCDELSEKIAKELF